ncbi:MAG TPA: Uma2 family endonuclease [Thermoanaerobaculia bacterium]|nr:Uma2 family endonuclease [Thermoanaerobaculia bacterium]
MYDNIVNFHDVSWEDYEHVCDMRGDGSVPRIHYLEGELEAMTPCREHHRLGSGIGRLVEAWCFDRDIDFSAFRSWTLKDERVMTGAEADECYIFGTDTRRDRPHLAIEVEWTEGVIDRPQIYKRLGVDELWIWRKGIIDVYPFSGNRIFPDLDLTLLASMLDRNTTSQAIRDFRKALAER